jgi:hypothetical protein
MLSAMGSSSADGRTQAHGPNGHLPFDAITQARLVRALRRQHRRDAVGGITVARRRSEARRTAIEQRADLFHTELCCPREGPVAEEQGRDQVIRHSGES